MTDRPLRVLMAAHDAGGVNIMVPLFDAWRAGRGIEPWFVGTPAVCREMAWRVPNLRIVPWCAAVTETAVADASTMARLLERHFDGGDWDAVVCATSANILLEKIILRHARACAVPTFAYCDMWWAYAERFSDGGGWYMPDRLFVVDERMKSEASAVAWPGAITIEAVGSPMYEALIERRAGSGAQSANAALRFISEPASTRFPASGIDEFEIAEELIRLARAAGVSRRITVRTHPVDHIEAWRRFVWRNRDQGVEFDVAPLEECVEDTWAAVGISSILLTELAMGGVPVASFQPKAADPGYFCLPFAEFGIARLADGAAFQAWLSSVDSGIPAAASAKHRGAVERITRRLLDVALPVGQVRA